MKKIITITAACLALSGCVSAPKVNMTSTFDAAQATKLLQPGANHVSGSALIRQAGGGVVTCAGGTVFLMPGTEYAREWALRLYGSSTSGYFPARGPGLDFTNLNTSFAGAVRQASCNAQGGFAFDNVADGNFLLFTKIIWRAGNETQGGSVMKSVSVSGGQKKEVVIAP